MEFQTVKIQSHNKNELRVRLEQFASKINETARQMVIADPQIFAEQVRRKGVELFSLLKSSFLKNKMNTYRPAFLRAQVKKRVIDSLENEFLYPEVVDTVTDTLIQAAQVDPHYRRVLGL